MREEEVSALEQDFLYFLGMMNEAMAEMKRRLEYVNFYTAEASNMRPRELDIQVVYSAAFPEKKEIFIWIENGPVQLFHKMYEAEHWIKSWYSYI